MDKSKLLDQCGALGEDRTLLARVLDRAKQASERNIPAATDFLSPAQQAQAADLLHAAGIPETAYIRWGGTGGAPVPAGLDGPFGRRNVQPHPVSAGGLPGGRKPDPSGFFGESHGYGDRPGENRRYFSRAGQR